MDAPKNIPEVPKKEIKERLINEGFKDSEPSAFVRMSVLARNDVEVLIKSKEVCIGLPIKPPKKPAWELRPSEIGNFSGFKRILKDHFEKQPDPPYQRGNFKENNRGYLVGQVEIDETDDFESIFQKIMALVEEGENWLGRLNLHRTKVSIVRPVGVIYQLRFWEELPFMGAWSF